MEEVYQNKKKVLQGHFAAAFTCFVWGSTFISTKLLLKTFTPIEILFIRFVIGYLTLWLVYPHKLRFTSWKEERHYIFAGLCGISLYYLFENIALTFTLASNVGIVVAVAPFFTAVNGCIFLKEKRPGALFYMGFVLAMTGIFLLSFAPGQSVEVSPKGDLLAVLAALIWSFYSITTKKISEFGYHVIQTTRRCFFYGLLGMIPVLFFMDFQVSLADFMDKTVIFQFIFLSFIASAFCFVTWNFAVKRLGPTKTSVYIYGSPVVTTICSAVVLHEHITKRAIFGIVCVLVGLVLSEQKLPHKKSGVSISDP